MTKRAVFAILLTIAAALALIALVAFMLEQV